MANEQRQRWLWERTTTVVFAFRFASLFDIYDAHFSLCIPLNTYSNFISEHPHTFFFTQLHTSSGNKARKSKKEEWNIFERERNWVVSSWKLVCDKRKLSAVENSEMIAFGPCIITCNLCEWAPLGKMNASFTKASMAFTLFFKSVVSWMQKHEAPD